jgi:hypothetical protein
MVDVMPNIPPGSLVAVVKLPGFDEVVVMIEEVEDVLVILVLLGCVVVDVAVSHVEDIMPIAEFWNSREQEFWIHDFASGVNLLQVHPPRVPSTSAQFLFKFERKNLHLKSRRVHAHMENAEARHT